MTSGLIKTEHYLVCKSCGLKSTIFRDELFIIEGIKAGDVIDNPRTPGGYCKIGCLNCKNVDSKNVVFEYIGTEEGPTIFLFEFKSKTKISLIQGPKRTNEVLWVNFEESPSIAWMYSVMRDDDGKDDLFFVSKNTNYELALRTFIEEIALIKRIQ